MLSKEQVEAIDDTSVLTWLFLRGEDPPKSNLELLKQTALELYAENERLAEKYQQGVDYARALSDDLDRVKFELDKLKERIKQIRQACSDTDPMVALDKIEKLAGKEEG